MCEVKIFIYIVTALLSVVGSEQFDAEFPDSNGILPSPSAEKKRLIIDTDAGADDGVAILNILGAESFGKVAVEMFTTVRGNTHTDNVAINVLKILKTVNRLDIPVYRGANQSLVWTPAFDNVFGEDGFGDFPFKDPPSKGLIKKKHAVNALIKAAALFRGELTLVCLGPLTNIALAIKLDNDFLKNLKEIYVLGGSDSGIGNIKPGVEFNFYVDPEAAKIVFKEAEKKNITVHLAPWETPFVRSVLDMKWRKEELGIIDSPQVDLINKAEGLTLTGDTWISADTVLSAVVIDNSIVETANLYHVDVETCGHHSRAALFVDYALSENATKNARIVKNINVNHFKKMLLQNLNLRDSPANGASRI